MDPWFWKVPCAVAQLSRWAATPEPMYSNCRSHVETVLPGWLSGKESTRQCRRHGFNPWVRMIPWRRKRQPTLVFLSGTSHGQRSLAGCSPWGHSWTQLGDWACMGRQGRNKSRNSKAALGNVPGSPSRDIPNNILELFCRYWNPHQVGNVKDMLSIST